jgi:hypothetical protein
MQLGSSVYNWWYWGLGGLGGWSLFLLLAIAAIAYVFFDSANRGIKAAGWRVGTLLPLVLFVPTVLFRFTNPTRPIDPMASEWFMVFGVLGAVIAIAAGVGYAVSYWGVTTPTSGLGAGAGAVVPPVMPPAQRSTEIERRAAPPKPPRDLAGAWLVDETSGRQYNLYRGDTRLGRHTDNDVVFSDLTVSREQALIRAEGNTFTLYDRGSSSGTFVNGQRVRSPVILYHGDTIEMGEVKLTFVTSQR